MSIGPPSGLFKCRKDPVVADVLNGKPVTLDDPPNGILPVSLPTLVIVTALPFASLNLISPLPNILTVRFAIFNASIVFFISVASAIPDPYATLPLVSVVTDIV